MIKQGINKRIAAAVVALAVGCFSVVGIMRASATTSAMLSFATSGEVELDGTSGAQVTVSLTAATAGKLYVAQGAFSTTELDDSNGYFVVNSFVPSEAVSSYSLDNSSSSGKFYYKYSQAGNGVEFGSGDHLYEMTYNVSSDTPAGTYHLPINVEYVQGTSLDDYEEEVIVDATVTVVRNDTPATKPAQTLILKDGEGHDISGTTIDKHYGDEPFTVTWERPVGDGAVSFHPDDPGVTEHVARTSGNSVEIDNVGSVNICAWAEETEAYAPAQTCITVNVSKRPLDITGVTIEDKTYDGTTEARVTGVTFEDRALASSDYNVVSAEFDDPDADTDKVVRVSVELSGDAANNYVLNASNYNATKTISPFTLRAEDMSISGGSTHGYVPGGVEPGVVVTANIHNGLSTLVSGTDYEVAYSNNDRVGSATVSVTGKGNFTTGASPIELGFNIEARGINNDNMVAPSSIVEGHILAESEISMVVDGVTLTKCATDGATGCDYVLEISGDNDGVVGHNVHVAIEGRNNYTGVAVRDYTIVAKLPQTVTIGDVTNTTVNKTYGDAKFTYTATTDGDGGITFASNNTGVATVDENTGEVTIMGVGSALITATATETDTYASGSASYTVKVGKKTISFASATVPFKKYDGTVNATVSEASLSESSLVFGTDFTVTNAAYPSANASTYANTVYVEVSLSASVTDRYQFSDSGATTASINVSSAITPFTLSTDNTTVTIDSTPLYYTGEAQTPGVTAKVDLDGDGTKETDLTNADYTVSYYENVNVGTATVLINGKGNYAASPDGSHFTINKAVVTNLSATAESQTYTGSALEPAVTVTGTVNGSNVIFTTDDYSVAEHAEFVNAGDHTFTINGKAGSNYDIPATNGTFTIEKADSGEPAEFSEEFRIEAGKTLADLGERSAGFSWTDATTPVAVGSNNYSATYIRDNDATNYNPSNLSLPVYGLKKVNVAVTDSAAGGTSSSNSAMVLEGEDAVITFIPDDKFELASVTVNGTDRTADVSNNKLTITAGADDIAVVASYRRVYEVVEGNGQTHVKNVDGSADFEIDAPFAYFNSKVFVDGALVSADNYEAWGKNPLAEEGSGEELLSLMASDDLTHTMVRLTEAYLNTLSVGEHALAVQFSDDGIARAVFYIEDPEAKAADTGVFTGVAGGAVATGLGFMALGVMAGAVYAIKRH